MTPLGLSPPNLQKSKWGGANRAPPPEPIYERNIYRSSLVKEPCIALLKHEPALFNTDNWKEFADKYPKLALETTVAVIQGKR